MGLVQLPLRLQASALSASEEHVGGDAKGRGRAARSVALGVRVVLSITLIRIWLTSLAVRVTRAFWVRPRMGDGPVSDPPPPQCKL